MATLESVQRARREREEAERKNPLLRLGLGELVREMNMLCILDPSVVREQTSRDPSENYQKYESLVQELDRREREYSSYKSPPRF